MATQPLPVLTIVGKIYGITTWEKDDPETKKSVLAGGRCSVLTEGGGFTEVYVSADDLQSVQPVEGQEVAWLVRASAWRREAFGSTEQNPRWFPVLNLSYVEPGAVHIRAVV